MAGHSGMSPPPMFWKAACQPRAFRGGHRDHLESFEAFDAHPGNEKGADLLGQARHDLQPKLLRQSSEQRLRADSPLPQQDLTQPAALFRLQGKGRLQGTFLKAAGFLQQLA